MLITIDIDELRRDIQEYYGTAAFSGFPMAILDECEVEDMSDEELLEKADELGIDLLKYRVD